MPRQIFTVIALVIFTRAFLFILFTDIGAGYPASNDLASDKPVTASHPEILFTYIAIYAISGLMLLSRWREVVQLAYQEKFIVLLLLLAALSSLWTAAPGLTLARTVALAGCTVFGVFFALSYTPVQQLKLLAWAAIFIITSSYITAIYYPDTGVMAGFHEGLWRGIYAHKNVLGRAASLGMLALFLLAAQSGKRSGLYWLFFWMGLMLLLLSASRLSIAVYISLFVALGCFSLLRKQKRLGGIALFAALIAASGFLAQIKYKIYPSILIPATTETLIVSGNSSAPLEKALKDAPQTAPRSSDNTYLAQGAGRIAIWKLVWEKGMSQPWLGYGFGGFWRGAKGPSGEIWDDIELWNPSDAHNGFLDLWLELGALGLGLFLAGAISTCARAFKSLQTRPFEPVNLLAPGVIAFVLLSNIGESDLLMPNYICWVLYVSSAVSLLIYSPGNQNASGNTTAPQLS